MSADTGSQDFDCKLRWDVELAGTRLAPWGGPASEDQLTLATSPPIGRELHIDAH
jgi:hypothetical protein